MDPSDPLGGAPSPPNDEPNPATEERTGLRSILADPAVRVITLVVFVVMLGFGLILPILPLYARSFGVGYDAAGLLISSFAFSRLVFDLFSGLIVDRLGERVSASAGLFLVGATSVLMGFAPNFTLLVVFRALGGAGSAVLFTAFYSYLLKIVPKDRMARTLSVFYGSFNVGVIAGGPVGGVIAAHLGLASPLFFYAGACFIGGLLYLRFVHDPPPRAEPPPLAREEVLVEREVGLLRRAGARVTDILRLPAFPTIVVVNLAYFWMVGTAFDTLMPLYAGDRLGMTSIGIGAVLAVAIAAELVVLYPAGSAADRYGRRAVLIPSLVGLGVGTIAIGFMTTPLALAAAMAVTGIASGYAGVPPAAMLSDVVPERDSGTAVGVFRFAGDLGFVLGPLVGGITARSFGFRWAFATVAIPIVAGLILAVRTPETLRRAADRP